MRSPAPRAGGNRAGNRAGAQPLDSTASPSDQILCRLRRQRQIEALHRFGARVVGELLDELARHHRIGRDIDQRLARYARLDPDVLSAVGNDRFPAGPVHSVAGGDDDTG